MNIDQVLQAVQDFRSQLEVWGITSEALWFVAVFASLLFALSLREVAGWYFRIHKMRDELHELRQQMAVMQEAQEEALELLTNLQPQTPQAAATKTEPANSTVFRLDH